MNNPELATKYGGKVRALLEKADAFGIPIDVERVAVHIGLTVIERPLEDEYSGFLAVKDKTIVVNSGHPHTRQRFTIAHEIGHYQLHSRKADTPVFIDPVVYFRSEQSSATGGVSVAERMREREANHFAAELLIPANLLAKYLDEHPLNPLNLPREIKELAGEFEVSKQAMEFRLSDLGFVNWV